MSGFYAPLYDAVTETAHKDVYRFHMPGHSGGGGHTSFFASAKYDLTELSGLDNLHAPGGVIQEAEDLLACAYGSDRAYMFTCGATACIHTAVRCVAGRGRIVTVSDMHKSFFAGLALFDLTAERVDVSDLVKRLEKGDVGSVFCTSPDYFGNTLDIKKISDICSSYGVLFVVDGAHAAHFAFSPLLPVSPSQTADIAVLSMHKTMSALGGGAVLCAGGAIADELGYYRALVHTTSPSYPVMASMDYARALWSEQGAQYYAAIKNAVDSLKYMLPEPYKTVKNDDFSRLVIDCGGDAESVMHALEDKGIYCEAAFGEKLVLIITPSNYTALPVLVKALEGIKPAKTDVMPALTLQNGGKDGIIAFADIDCCEGERAGADMGIYPPGVPQIHTGDIIDKEAARFIAHNKSRMFGLAYGRVVVLK